MSSITPTKTLLCFLTFSVPDNTVNHTGRFQYYMRILQMLPNNIPSRLFCVQPIRKASSLPWGTVRFQTVLRLFLVTRIAIHRPAMAYKVQQGNVCFLLRNIWTKVTIIKSPTAQTWNLNKSLDNKKYWRKTQVKLIIIRIKVLTHKYNILKDHLLR